MSDARARRQTLRHAHRPPRWPSVSLTCETVQVQEQRTATPLAFRRPLACSAPAAGCWAAGQLDRRTPVAGCGRFLAFQRRRAQVDAHIHQAMINRQAAFAEMRDPSCRSHHRWT